MASSSTTAPQTFTPDPKLPLSFLIFPTPPLTLPPNFDPAVQAYPPGLEPPRPYRPYRDRDIVCQALSADDDALMWKLFKYWLRNNKRLYRKHKREKERRFKIFKANAKKLYDQTDADSWTGLHVFADRTEEEWPKNGVCRGLRMRKPFEVVHRRHSPQPFTRDLKSTTPPSAIASYPPGSEPPQPYRTYNDMAVLRHALSADDNSLMKKLFKQWTVDTNKSYLTKKEKKQHFKIFKANAKKMIARIGADLTEERDEACSSRYEASS